MLPLRGWVVVMLSRFATIGSQFAVLGSQLVVRLSVLAVLRFGDSLLPPFAQNAKGGAPRLFWLFLRRAYLMIRELQRSFVGSRSWASDSASSG